MTVSKGGLKRLDIVTLFPTMVDVPLSESLIGKARERGVVDVRVHNLRDFSDDAKHRKVDDRSYGGGPGMVIRAEPVYRALKAIAAKPSPLPKRSKPHVILMSPQGRTLTQKIAQTLAETPWIVLLCGHYEGIDERAMAWVDDEVSIGDYVLTGGEFPALVVADTVIRLVPGVVKEADSIARDSFQTGRLDHPHYTRPAVWRGKKVPAILLSGRHAEIDAWRAQQAQAATKKKRPDLLKTRRMP